MENADSCCEKAFMYHSMLYNKLSQYKGAYSYGSVVDWSRRNYKSILEHDLFLVQINLGNQHRLLSLIYLTECTFYYLGSMHNADITKVLYNLNKWLVD